LYAKDLANNTSSCSFTLTRPNITPTAVNDVASVCPSASVNISVLTNDTHPQGSTLTINDFTLPSQGTLVKNANNTFTYTAPAGYSGPVTFTYNTKAADATLGFSENGHYYEWVPSPNITWLNAKTQAATKYYNGLQGYLVTITSATEMSFVATKLQGSGWMGASDLAYEGVWRWVTGPEGLEDGGLGRHFSNQLKLSGNNCLANTGVAVNGYYANWVGAEPNDCGASLNQYSPTNTSRGGEHYAHFYGGGVWNDYPNNAGNNIAGYIVEYGGLEGCIPELTATATVTITINARPSATIKASTTNAACPGTAVNLSTTATSAGTGFITGHQWLKDGVEIAGATNTTYAATATGSYSLMINNSNGCTGTSNSVTVTIADVTPPTILCPANNQPPVCLTVLTDYVTNATVSDNCTPAASIIKTQSPAIGTPFPAGTSMVVTLTATDAAGNTATCSFTVTKAAALSASASVSSVTCNGGSNGSINLTVTGGKPPYTYQWQNGSTSEDLSSLMAGNYFVLVKDAFLCAVTLPVTVSQPVKVTQSLSKSDNTCSGGSNGSITVSGIGGKAPYAYSKNNGVTFQTSNVFGNLPAGNYLIVTKDSSGCTSTTASVTVSEPAMVTATTMVSNVSCFGGSNGSVTVSATGGTSGETFTVPWPTSYFDNESMGFPTKTNVSKLTISSLGGFIQAQSGTVSYTIDLFNPSTSTWTTVHSNQTSSSFSFNSFSVTFPTISYVNAIRFTSSPAQNFSYQNFGIGMTQISLTGSVYSYAIDGSAYQSGNVFNNLTAGSYSITVKDAKGCVSAPVTVNIGEPAALDVTVASVTNVTCPGGSDGAATVNVSGGSGSYSYHWSPVGGNAATATGLEADNYSVTVTDAKGCSKNVTVAIIQADNVLPTAKAKNISIHLNSSGEVSITPSSVDDGSYDNCMISSITLSKSAFNCSDVGANPVVLTVTDNSGNESTAHAIVTVIDDVGPVISCPASVTVNCEGSTSATATGSATATDACGVASVTSSDASTQDPDATKAGHYNYIIQRTWTAVDINGNASTCVQTITVQDQTAPTFTRPADLTIFTDASCSYDASPAVTGDVIDESDHCATGLQATYSDVVSNGLCAGSLIITRTWHLQDHIGNAAADQVQIITVADNKAPIVTSTQSPVFHCYDANTAGAYSIPVVTATDNCTSSVNYKYLVVGPDNAIARTGNTNDASGTFAPGTSLVNWTVSDACGNTSKTQTVVTINPEITGSISNFTVLPQGADANTLYLGYTTASSANITVTAAGGTAPYTYSWSTNGSSTSFALVPGDPASITVTAVAGGVFTYTVVITDSKGCQAVISKKITVMDVRCGNNNDKVVVCHTTPGKAGNEQSICVSASAVDMYLSKGAYLGACTNTAVTRTTVPSDVIKAQASLMAYPNPSTGRFKLQLSGFQPGKVRVEVTDGMGKVVLVKQATISYSIEDISLDISKLAAGVYHVKAAGVNELKFTQIVIAR
jgi:hypothetical protein